MCSSDLVLGFELEFEFGEYAGVKLGDATLHIVRGNPNPPGSGHAYFFCPDVDVYFEQVLKNGATVLRELKDTDYGMRDFAIKDPDGNTLEFGLDTEAAV